MSLISKAAADKKLRTKQAALTQLAQQGKRMSIVLTVRARMTPRRLMVGMACAALVVSPAAAIAQDASSAEVLIGPFKQCGAIADNAERLTCFDAALRALPQALEKAENATREQLVAGFGLREQDARAQNQAQVQQALANTQVRENEDGDIEIASKVADVFTGKSGRSVLLLENGQLWTEASNSSFRGSPRPGWTATITRSRFGGHRLRFEERGKGYMSVTRVR